MTYSKLENQLEILHELSDDSIVSCFLARDKESAQEYIIRKVPRDLFAESGFERFQNEARLTSAIRCDTYSQPEAFEICESEVRVTYRYIRGRSLAKRYRESPLSAAEAIRLSIDLLEALVQVHQVGCVHRDIRPSNIIVSENGSATLCGYVPLWRPEVFGHNNRLGQDCAAFTSPELSGIIDHDIAESSDLYSLGYVLDAALAGAPAFDGDVSEILYRHMTQTPNLGRYPTEIPSFLIAFIDKLTQKEPRDRYQSAEAALFDATEIQKIIGNERSGRDFVLGSVDHRDELIDPAFVGREQTVGVILGQMQRTCGGDFSSGLILSPSGLGKTRLLTEVARIAARKNFFILHGRCSQHAAQEPSAPWLQMVDQLSNHLRRQPSYCEEISNQLIANREEITIAMPELAKVLGWKEEAISGPDESGQERVVDAFTKVFSALSGSDRPVLLTIDDAQWMDDQSKRVLEAVNAIQPRHLTLLVFSRPNDTVQADLTHRLTNPETITLHPIAPHAIKQLAESMAGPLPTEAIEVVKHYAEGSPFMATAVLRGMVESGVLTIHNRRWRIDTDKLSTFQAAEDAGQILSERLSQLPKQAKSLMIAAAVIGKDFNSDSAAELAGMPTEETASILQTVRKQRLVWTRPDSTISFVHDKIRETLLKETPDEIIRRMHGQYGRHLEATAPSRVFDLAYHFDAANLHDLALPHSIEAAKLARKSFSLASAEAQLSISIRAFRFASERDRHVVQMMMADVLLLQGEYDGCQVWLDKAANSATTKLEKAGTALKQGDLFFKRGNKDYAALRYEDSLGQLGHQIHHRRLSMWWNLAKEIGSQAIHSLVPNRCGRLGKLEDESEAMVLSLYSRVAHVYWYTRDKYWTLWAHLRGLNLAENYEPTDHLAQCYSEHAPGMTLLRWKSRGLKYAQKSLQIRQNLNDIWGQGQSRNYLSIFLYSFSQFEQCVRQARHAVEILERTGDYWEVHIGRYQLAAALYRLGRMDEAVEQAKINYESASRRGDYQATGNAVDVWARASLGAIPDEVLEIELSRKIHDHQRHCQVKLAQGIRAYHQIQLDKAIECFREAIETSENAKVTNTYTSPLYAWLCSALRRKLQTSPPRTPARYRSALKELKYECRRAIRIAGQFTNEAPHAYREYAIASAMSGNYERAYRNFNRSLKIARKQKADFEVATTILVQNEFALELGWVNNASELKDAVEFVSKVKLSMSNHDPSKSISLLDRFGSLLEVGREISTSILPTDIYKAACDAAQRILRVEQVCLVHCDIHAHPTGTFPSDCPYDPKLISEAADQNATLITDRAAHSSHGIQSEQTGSFLCSPIVVNGNTVAFLYLTNTRFRDIFGDDELRIAKYITTAAGAALEKADGFLQLRDLNLNLERKVEDRTAAVVERSNELEKTATQLRSAQEKLKIAKDAAEAANEAKSSFLARMSHEIRTPIAAVLGFTELMLRGLIQDDQEQKKHLATIHSNGKHLLHLLNEILDLSKIEADQVEIESVPCQPAVLLTEIIASLKSQAVAKSLELDLEIQGDLPDSVNSDPTRIRQILTNLIGNAIKFTDAGSVIVTIRGEVCGNQKAKLEITVRDTGIGMSPEQMRKIFEPFTQADTSTTRKYGGTGLGLSISKGLAERLGGSLSLTSEPEQGTHVSLELPVTLPYRYRILSNEEAVAKTFESQTQEFVTLDLRNVHVLVVDDQPTNRDLLELLLTDAGALVTTANDGEEAIQSALAPDQTPDAILLDMQMPNIDGYTAANILRQEGFTQPIIAMTANAMTGDDQKCKAAGCSDYLSKPIDLNRLLELVEKYTGGKRKGLRNLGSHCSLEKKAERPKEARASLLPDSWLREFACDLVDRVTDEIPQLINAYESGNFNEIGRLAHWMKGSGGTVGLPKLTDLAIQCEKAVKADQAETILGSIQEIKEFVTCVNDEREMQRKSIESLPQKEEG